MADIQGVNKQGSIPILFGQMDIPIPDDHLDTSTKEFKQRNLLTVKSFATEVASYNFWSFPKDARKEAQELLTVFNRYQKTRLDLQLEEAKLKTKKTTLAKITNKRKDFQALGKLQNDLFKSIAEKIITWYNKTYKGSKFDYIGDNFHCDFLSLTPKVEVKANKLYFIAQHGFDYLLTE